MRKIGELFVPDWRKIRKHINPEWVKVKETFEKLIESFVKGVSWPFTIEETPDVIRTLFEYCYLLSVSEILSRVVNHPDPGLIIPQFEIDPFSEQRNLVSFVNFFCLPWRRFFSNLYLFYFVWLIIFKKNPWLLDLYDSRFKIKAIGLPDEFRAVFGNEKRAVRAYEAFRENLIFFEIFPRFTISEILSEKFEKIIQDYEIQKNSKKGQP